MDTTTTRPYPPAYSYPSDGQADPGTWVHVRGGYRAQVEEVFQHPSGARAGRLVVCRQPDVPDALYEPDTLVRIELDEVTDHLAGRHGHQDALAGSCPMCVEEGWGVCGICGAGIPSPDGYCSQTCADQDPDR